MTENPLKSRRLGQTFESRFSALEWHKMAVAKGQKEAAAAWYRRAVELGEINGDGRYRASGD